MRLKSLVGKDSNLRPAAKSTKAGRGDPVATQGRQRDGSSSQLRY